MFKKQPSRLLAALLFAMTAAASVQAADFFVTSKIGQPLKAVAVINAEKGTVIRLAEAEAYLKRGLPLPSLEGFKFSFMEQEGGRPILRISTDNNYDNPAQTLLLEEFFNGQKTIKEYALLVDPPLPQEVQAAMSMEEKPAVKAEVVPKPKVKAKVAKKQSPSQFNTSLKSINDRISKLEKGQKELFEQLANTDKKLDNLITRFDGVGVEGKASKATPSVAPVVSKEKVEAPTPASVKNEVKKEEIAPQKVEKVKEVKKEEAAAPQKMEKAKEAEIKAEPKKEEVMPQKMDKAEVKKDKAPEAVPVVAASASTINDVSTTVTNSKTETVPAPAVAAPQAAISGEVKMEEKKPMAKKPIVVSEPVEEEKDVGEQFMGYLSENPVEAGGFLAMLIALVSLPMVLLRRRAKKAAVASDFTMQP